MLYYAASSRTYVTYDGEDYHYYINSGEVNKNQWMNICGMYYYTWVRGVEFRRKMKYPFFMHDDTAPLESFHQEEWEKEKYDKLYGDYYLHMFVSDGNPRIQPPQWTNVSAHELEQNATRGSIRKSISQDNLEQQPDAKRARRF